MKVIINKCYGGFSLSEKAYKKLIEYGIPVRKYIKPERNPDTGLYEKTPQNEGQIIFDRDLDGRDGGFSQSLRRLDGRYWDSWSGDYDNRSHPLLIRVVEELGSEAASGKRGKLDVIEIPDGIEWEIDDYDGIETVHEKHRSWS